ncbi:phosphorylase [Dactylosporangium sp. CA-139066]|uniref:5'-methylthioadenosine/S-adenosylhomocysteine nucleosidase family protein n=1 Tax=Dactylosporangium sp. CA-139066 TaxID=3239930 RepID=UPI003D8F3EC7
MTPQQRLELYRRLGDSRHELADYLAIPAWQRQRFIQGNEARMIVEWLEQRTKLAELGPALLAIGRDDLAELTRAAPAGREMPARPLPERTAVVLTTYDAETLAVTGHLQEELDQLARREERGTLFEIGTFAGERSNWKVAIAEISAGGVTANAAIGRASAAFQPDAVLLVGVAGGLQDLAPGDVVAADAIYDHDAGEEYPPEVKMHAPGHRLQQHARLVARHGRWQRQIRPPGPATPPRAVIRPVVPIGNVVGEDRSAAAARLRRCCSDAVAAGFEGLLHGAYLGRRTEALAVLGISEMLGVDEPVGDEHRRSAAARHAAAFAFTVLDSAGSEPDAQPAAVSGTPGRYTVNITGGQGVRIGDHNVQTNHFGQ